MKKSTEENAQQSLRFRKLGEDKKKLAEHEKQFDRKQQKLENDERNQNEIVDKKCEKRSRKALAEIARQKEQMMKDNEANLRQGKKALKTKFYASAAFPIIILTIALIVQQILIIIEHKELSQEIPQWAIDRWSDFNNLANMVTKSRGFLNTVLACGIVIVVIVLIIFAIRKVQPIIVKRFKLYEVRSEKAVKVVMTISIIFVSFSIAIFLASMFPINLVWFWLVLGIGLNILYHITSK